MHNYYFIAPAALTVGRNHAKTSAQFTVMHRNQ